VATNRNNEGTIYKLMYMYVIYLVVPGSQTTIKYITLQVYTMLNNEIKI